MFLLIFFFIVSSTLAQVDDNYVELVKLNNTGQYQLAIFRGKVLLAQHPELAKVYGQLSFAFTKSGKIHRGIAYFDSLRKKLPQNPYNYYGLALLQKEQQQYDLAITNLKKSIHVEPHFAAAYSQLVEIYDTLNNLQDLQKYFTNLMARDSVNGAVYYGLGNIQKAAGEWDRAIKSFKQALKYDADILDAYYSLGLVYIKKRDFRRALETWEMGLDRAQRLNDIRFEAIFNNNIGNSYYDSNKWRKGLAFQQKALKLARKIEDKSLIAKCLSSIASSNRVLGKPQKALELYHQAMKIAKSNNDVEFQEKIWGNLCAVYGDINDYSRSAECGLKAIKMAEARGDSAAVAQHCRNISGAYGPQAKFELALKYLKRALRIKENETPQDHKEMSLLLGNMAMCYKDMGNMSKAIRLLKRAVKITRENNLKHHEQAVLGQLGYAYTGLSEFSRAKTCFKQALKIARQFDDLRGQAMLLGNLAIIHKEEGDFSRALKLYNQALRMDKKIKNRRGVIRHYVNMANLYEIRGDYIRALELEKRALALSDSIGTVHYSAIILGNIGVAYDKLGDFEQALSYFDLSLEKLRKIPMKEYEPSVLTNMGSVYERIGSDTVAIKKYKEALQIAKSIGNKEDQVNCLIAIGNVLTTRKDYSRARAYFNQSLNKAREIRLKIKEGRIYLALGNLYKEKGELKKAFSFYKKALTIGKTIDGFELIYESYGGLATIKEAQQQNNTALKYYKKAIDKIESIRARLMIESYKTEFMENKIPLYESLITLLIKLKKFDEAYEYIQRFRARSFLEIIGAGRKDIAEGISPDRLQKYRYWEQRLREIYHRLTSINREDKSLLSALEDSLQYIRQQHQKIIEEIEVHHPQYARLVGISRPPTIYEIKQKIASPAQAIIEYFVAPEISSVWVIKRDTIICKVLDISKEQVEKAVLQLRQPFEDVKEGRIRNITDINFDLNLALDLYNKIFLPIRPYLTGCKDLTVVSDGVLHYLPFEALVTKIEKKSYDRKVIFSRYRNAHYLLEDYTISYLPAASLLGMQPFNALNKKKNLLAFANPRVRIATAEKKKNIWLNIYALLIRSGRSWYLTELPRAEQEVKTIANIMKSTKIYLDREAKEEYFKKESPGFPFIHLATHCIIEENQPMYSRILFALDNDPKEDGFLHTYEVFNLKLNSRLVTLSACETGLGKLSRGEGLIGLARAFMYAGASSLVVSLWSVDESTAELMKHFYLNLENGMAISTALQQAKLKLLKREGKFSDGYRFSFAHPFLWAPFVLIGER